ncbi:retropepsin-like aspartic protease family protein [Pontixanthobacter aquaemixtae]|uniref:TIGR02281 family clan AA aspartic protease n=1 Tax=Pontixanthobacter aquaemixtae TaxID=1958940 RepID=A0A844ZVM5_9SPHN|nr:TIGR02281 family clan AA aspartic protease [Pontixanthobacter aquaemixtae]MXO91778.1 TIGR02281 family clan AA aspartic protease [Pontixanthobacter aquaemixtae]
MNRFVIFSGVLVFAVITAFPSGGESAAEQTQSSEPRGVDTSDWNDTGAKVHKQTGRPELRSRRAQNSDAGSSSWNSGGHTLQRQSDGHFYANGTVQGASTHFLVDTGASIIALTGPDAQAAGLTWSSSDIMPIGSGASGAVYGVPVMIDQVEIGGFTQRNVRAVVIPEGLEVSLLGQSFLSQIKSVEIERDRMIWKSS